MKTTEASIGYWTFLDRNKNFMFAEDTAPAPPDFHSEIAALMNCYGEPCFNLEIQNAAQLPYDVALQISWTNEHAEPQTNFAYWTNDNT